MSKRIIGLSFLILLGSATVLGEYWWPAPDMHVARFSHQSVTLPNGDIVVLGGSTGDGSVATQTVEMFDPDTQTWTQLPDIPQPLSYFAAALFSTSEGDLRILAAGGNIGGSECTRNVYLFDVEDESWYVVGYLDSPRERMTAVSLANGDVFLAGGQYFGTYYDDCYVFDVRSYVLRRLDDYMSDRRAFAMGALLSDTGEVIICGGANASSGGMLRSSDIYDPGDPDDPADDSIRPGPWLNLARQTATATSLRDGRVLVTGGESGDDHPEDTAEILEHIGGGQYEWNLLSSTMGSDRYYHDTAVLADGRVVIAGGLSDYGVLNRTIAIFDPTTETFEHIAEQSSVGRYYSRSHVVEIDGQERVLVSGGGTTHPGSANATNTCEYIDPQGGAGPAPIPLTAEIKIVQAVEDPEIRDEPHHPNYEPLHAPAGYVANKPTTVRVFVNRVDEGNKVDVRGALTIDPPPPGYTEPIKSRQGALDSSECKISAYYTPSDSTPAERDGYYRDVRDGNDALNFPLTNGLPEGIDYTFTVEVCEAESNPPVECETRVHYEAVPQEYAAHIPMCAN